MERFLAEGQQTDQREDDLFGEGKATEDLPGELADAKRRLERLRKAKEELEKEAQQMLEQATAELHTSKGGTTDQGSRC